MIALTPKGRPLTQAVVEELAAQPALTLLSARFEGFDERIVEHLATDAISVGPYVLSNGDLPAMIVLDAVARRLPGALAEGSGRARELLGRARRRARVSALHAAGRVPRLERAGRAALRRPRARRGVAAGAGAMSDDSSRTVPSSTTRTRRTPPEAGSDEPGGWPDDEPATAGRTGRRRAARPRRVRERLADSGSTRSGPATASPPRHWGQSTSRLRRLRLHAAGGLFADEAARTGTAPHSRDPLARLFPGLPRGVRVTLDWILTIAGAILIVLALKQWVVNPYRIPSSSMEPTLNCAKGPANPGCLGDSSDRVLACRICLDFGRTRRAATSSSSTRRPRPRSSAARAARS